MGLDMFLNAKRFLWHNEGSLKAALWAVIPDAPGEPKEITIEVLYWRKENALHRWFVENVQKGNDDCRHYHVSVAQLAELLRSIHSALANRDHADAILPTQSGFFFGSTEYDEDYWQGLEQTAKKLGDLLENMEKYKGWGFEYHSSW